MAQLFHPSFNNIAKVSIISGILLVIGAVTAWAVFLRSSFVTRQRIPIEQPIQFSHQHHVAGLGIDCRYCHTSVEVSPYGGIPPIHTCMTCHSQIWADSPYLTPVRQSYQTGIPIQWIRVNDLPDFVFFRHDIHLYKGIGCAECHGPVDRMPLMWQDAPLSMQWCLACHRHPEKFVRPREEVFNMTYEHPPNQEGLGAYLVQEYAIQSKTWCSACHR